MVYEKFAAGLEEGLEKSAVFTIKSILGPIGGFFNKIFRPLSSPSLRYPQYKSKYYNPRDWFAPLSPELKRRAELNLKLLESHFKRKYPDYEILDEWFSNFRKPK
jgi:hypothetical protein